MTVDRQKGRIIFSCDGCGETVGDEPSRHSRLDFASMWEELKSEGWRAVKNLKGAWSHFCPACKED